MMAASTGKTYCVKCGKVKCTLRCGGCLQEFCFNHLEEHRRELNQQLEDIEVNRDLVRQSLIEQAEESKEHPLVQEINTWEEESIEQIRKTADEIRQVLFKHTSDHFNQLENKLNMFTNRLREIRQEDDFNEINLLRFQEELARLTIDLEKTPKFSFRQNSTCLINSVGIDVSDRSASYITVNAKTDSTSKDISQTDPKLNTEKTSSTLQATIERIGKTHQQADNYSRRRIDQISEVVAVAITRIVTDTEVQQATLFAEGNTRATAVEEEYRWKLRQYMGELDTVKAQNFEILERDLHFRQDMIIEEAKQRIDELHEKAKRPKPHVIRAPQVQPKHRH